MIAPMPVAYSAAPEATSLIQPDDPLAANNQLLLFMWHLKLRQLSNLRIPMSRCLVLALLVLLGSLARADTNVTARIGATDIKLSTPAGMVDMPNDDITAKAMADLTPPDSVLLHAFVSSEAVDTTKPSDPDANIMTTHIYALKDAPMDIDSGFFIDFVAKVANDATHSVLVSQYSGFDYDDAQKRLDQFAKDTGVGIKQDGDVYSLGMVSRSDACVSYMEAQYLTVTEKGKTERVQCVSVVGYLRLNQKAVVVITSMTKPTILQDDLRTLKHAAERYQLDLQILNNP
jgi:hypothetical protein